MKRSSCSTLLVLVVASIAPTSTSAESRRSFGGMPAFLQKSSSSQSIAIDRTENALYSPTRQQQTTNCDSEPCDREIRYAVQKGDEIKASRAIEYAYLQVQDDEEFPVIPACNTRTVPSNRPLENDLYHV